MVDAFWATRLVQRRFLLFNDLAYVRLVAGIAFTRQARATGAANLVIHGLSGWFSHTQLMLRQLGHSGFVMKKRAGLAPKIASIPRAFRLRRQFLADGGGRITDLIDQFLQLLLVHAQLLGPILDLVRLVHVDLAAVLRTFLLQVVHLSPRPRLR